MELAMITDTVRLARRLIRAQLKKPFYILLSVSQPLMYLVFFGAMFSNMPGMSQDQQSYIYFLTPGMVVMAALFGSAYLSALSTLADADRALFDSIVISPVNRLSISMSYVFANLVAVMLQMLTIAVAGVLLGGYPVGRQPWPDRPAADRDPDRHRLRLRLEHGKLPGQEGAARPVGHELPGHAADVHLGHDAVDPEHAGLDAGTGPFQSRALGRHRGPGRLHGQLERRGPGQPVGPAAVYRGHGGRHAPDLRPFPGAPLGAPHPSSGEPRGPTTHSHSRRRLLPGSGNGAVIRNRNGALRTVRRSSVYQLLAWIFKSFDGSRSYADTVKAIPAALEKHARAIVTRLVERSFARARRTAGSGGGAVSCPLP
ncbi:ABC transporter permease [Massilia sp. B-10]|nr:ABC transporter permease [Massilia sp. B-10]